MSKLWGGRFTKQTNALVEEYTASIGFDKQLAEEDIQGSLAHVSMLGKCGIVPAEDVETIKAGLNKVLERIREGSIEFSVSDEDIHMNIEKNLIEEVGPVGETPYRTKPERPGSDRYASVPAQPCRCADRHAA